MLAGRGPPDTVGIPSRPPQPRGVCWQISAFSTLHLHLCVLHLVMARHRPVCPMSAHVPSCKDTCPVGLGARPAAWGPHANRSLAPVSDGVRPMKCAWGWPLSEHCAGTVADLGGTEDCAPRLPTRTACPCVEHMCTWTAVVSVQLHTEKAQVARSTSGNTQRTVRAPALNGARRTGRCSG